MLLAGASAVQGGSDLGSAAVHDLLGDRCRLSGRLRGGQALSLIHI